MNLSGEIAVRAPRQAVFDAVRDARFFASCIDGVRELEEIDPTHYTALFETKLAYMTFRFKVAVEVTPWLAPQVERKLTPRNCDHRTLWMASLMAKNRPSSSPT